MLNMLLAVVLDTYTEVKGSLFAVVKSCAHRPITFSTTWQKEGVDHEQNEEEDRS